MHGVEPTGDLGRLARWWREHGPDRPCSVAWINDPIDPSEAGVAVDRAVDSGATLLAVHAHGDDIAARAVIASVTKSTPVQVRDQPEGMSDLDWMRAVAAIRDRRAQWTADSDDPGIAAVTKVMQAARRRGTPVLFDGLTAHAGTLLVGEYDDSWLPAASSTDPAVTLAQEHWRVRPAIDLHLGGDDDSGLHAVLALMDLLTKD